MGALLARLTPPLGIGALLAIAGLSAALMLSRARLDSARQALTAERALRAADAAAFEAAQARADASWRAEVARIQNRNRRLNDDADRKVDAARADYATRVLRLPPAPADPGPSGGGALPGAELPARADRSGGAPILLDRADALICAANTARLEAAHEWAAEPGSPAE